MIQRPEESLSRPNFASKSIAFRLFVVIASFSAFATSGCTAPRTLKSSREYILAARYEVNTRRNEATGDSQQKVRTAFSAMKSRGFNAVLADFVPDVRRIEVLDAASECGLRAYLTDGDLHYYLLTGKLRDANAVDGLVRSKLGPLLSHRAFAGVAVLGGYPPDRVAVVLAALDAAGVNQLVPGQSGYTASGGAIVAWLDAQRPSIPNVSQVERLYHEYHSEIHAGWNDGLVIDFLPEEAQESAVRAPTPLDSAESPNLATVDSTVFDEILPKEGARSRQFAAESLVRRAQVWGSRLNGCVREPMSLPKEGNPAMTATLFHRDQRRYLFLFNQSSEPVRGTIRLTASSFGTKVARAVEVPSSVHQVAGEVHVARNGELVLSPVLRAGDAMLYELF